MAMQRLVLLVLVEILIKRTSGRRFGASSCVSVSFFFLAFLEPLRRFFFFGTTSFLVLWLPSCRSTPVLRLSFCSKAISVILSVFLNELLLEIPVLYLLFFFLFFFYQRRSMMDPSNGKRFVSVSIGQKMRQELCCKQSIHPFCYNIVILQIETTFPQWKLTNSPLIECQSSS